MSRWRLLRSGPHTHKAVDDVREQGEISARLFSCKEED